MGGKVRTMRIGATEVRLLKEVKTIGDYNRVLRMGIY